MPTLKEFIERELGDKDSGQVEVRKLYEATRENPYCTRLVGGLFLPDVGVIGEWSHREMQVVYDITDAREQGHTLIHEFGRAMTGADDSKVERHKRAYETLEHMRPGDIARVQVGSSVYLLAAFPSEFPAPSLVLFVKS